MAENKMNTNMDDLVEAMTAGASVSGDSFSSTAAAGHPHFSSYKNRNMAAEKQASRRKEFLEQQKEKRSAALALVRHLGGVETDDGEDVEPELMDATSAAAGGRARRQRRQENPFHNQLMCSEWLVDVPENMASEWIMVPCPEGRRVLVIANKGSTKAYAKNGRLLKEFPSVLPGGFRNGQSNTTVLDCVFCEDKSLFYCLDVLCWNGHPVFDSDTEFRFFWLKSKLDDCPELRGCATTNRYAFEYLPRCWSNTEEMETMMKEKFPFKLDGVLFYHKGVHYTAGQTPLVGWLKPFMLPEMLGVQVPSEYSTGFEGTQPSHFIADFNTKYEKEHGGLQYGGKKSGERRDDPEDQCDAVGAV